MTDDNKNQCFKVYCKTLYSLRIKKRVEEPVERTLKISYDQLWITFGVNYRKDEIDRT